MITRARLKDWQKELAQQPKIYMLLLPGYDYGNIYNSIQAASYELIWRKGKGTIVCFNVMNEELSKERWEADNG